MKKHQIVILCGLTVGITVVGLSVIYMPFYSNASKEAKERQNGLLLDGKGGSRGSMWSNIDNKVKKGSNSS